jgi:hypothetical protein
MPLSVTAPHIKLMTTIHAFVIVLLLAFTASPAQSQEAISNNAAFFRLQTQPTP